MKKNSRKATPKTSLPPKNEKVVVENVNAPNHQTRVDRKKYESMKRALMKVLPKRPPGITQKEMFETVKGFLPEELFPAGAKAAWWAKTVQLDLEAKGLVKRTTETKPTRWYRAPVTRK